MNAPRSPGLLLFFVPALLVACAAAPAPQPDRPVAAICQAGPARFAVGQQLTDALAREAQVRSGASRVRVLRPGEAHTMEFDERRLDLEVDAANRVIRVSCG